MLSHSKGKQKAAVRLKIRPQKSEQHGDSSWEKPLLSLHRSIGISGPATQSAWLQLGELNLGNYTESIHSGPLRDLCLLLMGAVPHGTQWTNPGHGKCFTFGAEPLRHHHLRISFCAKQSLWRFSASQKLCQSHIKAHEEYGIPYDQRHQPYTDGCIPEHHQLCSPRALLDPPKQGNSVCLQSIHPPCDAPPPSVHWVPAATGRPQAAPKGPSLGSS